MSLGGKISILSNVGFEKHSTGLSLHFYISAGLNMDSFLKLNKYIQQNKKCQLLYSTHSSSFLKLIAFITHSVAEPHSYITELRLHAAYTGATKGITLLFFFTCSSKTCKHTSILPFNIHTV